MAFGGALEEIEAGEGGGGDGVELAEDAVVAGAGEVEEEGNAVGPADKGVIEGRAVVAEEDGVSGGDEVLHQGVVRETFLQRSVREYVIISHFLLLLLLFHFHFPSS